MKKKKGQKPNQERRAEDEGNLWFSRYDYRDNLSSCLEPENL